MRRTLLLTASAAVVTFLLARDAVAQSSPGWSFGYTPTAAQWNAAFAAKQDYTGVVPLNITGGTMLGELTTAAPTTNGSGFNLAPGTGPSSPNNGDLWTTSAGIFVQINNSTIQLASGTSLGSILGQNNTWTATNNYTNVATFGTGITLALGLANFTAGMGAANPVVFSNIVYFIDNSQTVPLTSGSNVDGLAITWNFSSGPAEVDFWNTFTTAAESYEFKQITGSGTFKNLMNLGLTNGTAVTSEVYVEQFGTQSGAITFLTQPNAGTYNWEWPTTAGGSGQILTSAGGTGPMTWGNAGAGTVTSAQISPGPGLSTTGTCTITTTGNCVVNAYLGPPQGRLSLLNGSAVMTTSVSGSKQIYYTSYNGEYVPIYNGTALQSYQFSTGTSGLILNMNGSSNWATSTAYDAFAALNGTAVVLCTGPAWTTSVGQSSVRSLLLGLSPQGLLTNATGSFTCRTGSATTITVSQYQGTYLGSYIIDSSSSGQVSWIFGGVASGGSGSFLDVWNYYNRISVTSQVVDTETPYQYSSASFRSAGNSSGNRITFLIGAGEDSAYVSYTARLQTSAVQGAAGFWSIGYSATASTAIQANIGVAQAAVAVNFISPAVESITPGIGQNFFQAVEASDGVNDNVFDAASLNALIAVLRM